MAEPIPNANGLADWLELAEPVGLADRVDGFNVCSICDRLVISASSSRRRAPTDEDRAVDHWTSVDGGEWGVNLQPSTQPSTQREDRGCSVVGAMLQYEHEQREE